MSDDCPNCDKWEAAFLRERESRLRLSEQNADLQAERDAWMQQCNKAKRQRDHYRALLSEVLTTWSPPEVHAVSREALSSVDELDKR